MRWLPWPWPRRKTGVTTFPGWRRCGDRGVQPGRDLCADVRGRLARDDGRDDQLLRRRGRTSAHHLPGRDARVWQGDVPGPIGSRGGACEGGVSRRHCVGSPMGRRGIGNSWSAIPRRRSWTSGMRRSIWARRRRCCTGAIRDVQGVGRRGCHELKHEPGGAAAILKQLKSLAKARPWAKDHEDVQRAITYFENQSKAGRMDYPARVARNEPMAAGSRKRPARSSSSNGSVVRA